MAKKRYTKLGNIWKGEYGPYIRLGDDKSKNPKYNYTVQLRVLDSEGNVVTTVKNPLVSLYDPRKRKVEEGKEPRNVPEALMFEISLGEEVEE